MSLARKTWPGRGRILMTAITGTNPNALGESLNGSVGLVTGGSRGIGRAIARRLGELGAAVAICGRDENALAATARELTEAGVRVHWRIADVTRAGDVEALVAETEAKLGPISILVN